MTLSPFGASTKLQSAANSTRALHYKSSSAANSTPIPSLIGHLASVDVKHQESDSTQALHYKKIKSAANSTRTLHYKVAVGMFRALTKLKSVANSTRALHYKSSSELQIPPGPYTTKARVSCKFYPGPTLERRQRYCSGGAVLKLAKWLVDLSTHPGRQMNFSQLAPAYKNASLDKLVSKHAALRPLKRGGLLTSASQRLRTKTPP